MGTVWIPCRVEEGFTREELEEHVRREAMLFRASGNSKAWNTHSIKDEFERTRASYNLEYGPLHSKLLLKHDHWIIEILSHAMFPIEWQLDSERTVLPWQLQPLIEMWQGYREEVARGLHVPFLQQLFFYEHIRCLASVDVSNLTGAVRGSLRATGGWVQQPELIAVRDRILAGGLVEVPPPPRWPYEGGEADLSQVERAFSAVDAIMNDWNAAAKRGGKWHFKLQTRQWRFDDWVAMQLHSESWTKFMAWLEPWRRGGYGLYRDNE